MKWLYHATEEPEIVEDHVTREGWFDSPKKVSRDEQAEEPVKRKPGRPKKA